MDFATRRGAGIAFRKIEEMLNPPGLLQIIPEPVVRKVIRYQGEDLVITWIGQPYSTNAYRVTQVHARAFEVRPGDHGDFRGRIVECQPEGFMVEFTGARGPQRLWMPKEAMTFLEEQPAALVPEDDDVGVDDGAPGGAKARGVAAAIAALWPDGIPAGLSGKDRDRKVAEWLEANGLSVPADVGKAVRRANAGAARQQQD